MSDSYEIKNFVYINVQDEEVRTRLYKHFAANRNQTDIEIRLTPGAPGALEFTDAGELVFGDPDLVARLQAVEDEGGCYLVNAENPGVDVQTVVRVTPPETTLFELPDPGQGPVTVRRVRPVERKPPPGQTNLICPCTGP